MIRAALSKHLYKGKPVLLREYRSGPGYEFCHAIITYKNKFYLSPGNENFADAMERIKLGARESYSSFKAAYIAFKLIYGETRAV